MAGVEYVVYGAGAIGGLVGGRLAEAGRRVTLIARGPHLQALQDGGLRIESPAGTSTVTVPAVGRPDQVAWTAEQVVLLAVKSHQTHQALADLVAVAPPGTPIVCLQNGIANEQAALRFFPAVYGVCVMCPASHLQPGVVVAWSTPISGLLDLSRHPEGADDVAEAVAADLRAATFDSFAVPDIRPWKRRKLILNLGNAVEALCGPSERVGPLVDRLSAEGEAALAAAGLPTVTVAEDLARRGDLLQLGTVAGQRRQGGSSWQSLERSTGDIETDYLNGEIVLLGRLHGVPTPANELLQRLARQAAATGALPGSVSADQILAQLDGA
jgi:2-dehydropantoate 2-reductase